MKLYWYNLKRRDKRFNDQNAGDYFGRYILEKLGYDSMYNIEDPEIITCGSILSRGAGYGGTPWVWGSGCHNITDVLIPSLDLKKFKAVRGRLTREKLGLGSEVALGDPGLLASYFYKPKTTKKYKYGFICHYTDEATFKEKFGSLGVPIISMVTSNIEKLLDTINECEFIFSSSLHGIIFSHSLEIPAIHLENKMLFSKNNFKFKDYYSIFKNVKYVKDNIDTVDIQKYVNGDYSLYKPAHSSLIRIQKRLLKCFPYPKNKCAICAVAKCENEYINDWVKYHIDLGFDQIYIYDNNDEDYEKIETRIDSRYLDRVHITKIPGAKEFQIPTYNMFYNKFKNKFDWITFLDIDEYVVLKKWKNIREFLNDNKFRHYNVIRLNWHMFGDDNLIERDMSIPVYKGIKKRVASKLESQGKQFVRCVSNHNVEICSNHWGTFDGRLPKQIMPDGVQTTGKVSGLHNCEEAYINHYMTKTLSEFINQKLARGTDASFGNRKIDFNYFWRINKKTPEKLKYIDEYEKR